MKVQPTRGERVADICVNHIGSWRFIIIQACIMTVWALVNTLTFFHYLQFDKYPFIFMNLAMSAEAAFSSPLILMSQNRETQRDRARDDREAKEVDSLYQNHSLLLEINRQQLEILQEQHLIMKSLQQVGQADRLTQLLTRLEQTTTPSPTPRKKTQKL